MNDLAPFVRLVEALAPWESRLLFVGGWAHRLYRLHEHATPLAYQPLATLDADVAYARRERLDGDMRAALEAQGFHEQLSWPVWSARPTPGGREVAIWWCRST